MNKFLENVMNFINENTTLLIIICVFLIFVLIGYLIDNSIKTRKMEKKLKMESLNGVSKQEVSDEVVKEEIPVQVAEEVKDVAPEVVKVEENTVVEETPAVEVQPEPIVPAVEPVIEEKEDTSLKVDLELPEVEETKEEVTPAEPVVTNDEEETEEIGQREVTVDSKINDLLLRDFNKENEEKNINIDDINLDDTVSLNPIQNISSIEEPEVEKSSPYKNDKKLSDIFKKKEVKTEEKKVNLEKTEDYSKELDRILQKLNEASDDYSKDSTLDETKDFTNMF